MFHISNTALGLPKHFFSVWSLRKSITEIIFKGLLGIVLLGRRGKIVESEIVACLALVPL